MPSGRRAGLATYGIDLPWNCYGIPQRLFLDNAWAHHSYSLEDLASALAGGGRIHPDGTGLPPALPGSLWGFGGALFGNLSGQIQEQLPGAISETRPTALAQCQPGGLPVISGHPAHCAISWWWIIMHTPHRELDGMTPHEKWLRGLQLMTPLPPPLTPQLERYFLATEPRNAGGHAGRAGIVWPALLGVWNWQVCAAGIGRDAKADTICATTRTT